MKSKLIVFAAALALLLTACGQPDTADAALRVAASTYPVYLFATAIADGAEGVEVELVVNQQTSCLHDYTLTIRDMKIIDRADVIVINGAGLEEFLDRALDASSAPVIDCSQSVDLLPPLDHEDHGHDEGGGDPHFWLSTTAAAAMLNTIAAELSELDPDHAETYAANLNAALASLAGLTPDFSGLDCSFLITFHDGFQYFAEENGLTLLKAIEEEEGAEASAREVKEIISLIGEYELPAIFVEANGSDATAKAIARETGCEVYILDMIMSGEGKGLQPYLDAMEANYSAIMQAMGG